MKSQVHLIGRTRVSSRTVMVLMYLLVDSFGSLFMNVRFDCFAGDSGGSSGAGQLGTAHRELR